MKRRSVVLCFICLFFLAACDHEAAPGNPSAEVPSASKPATGGYEPTAAERVPGITMSQQELDKIYTEARRNMPVPVIPADESTQGAH